MSLFRCTTLLFLLGLMACASTRRKAGTGGPACDCTVLTGAEVEKVARDYDAKAILTPLSDAKAKALLAEGLLEELPGMLGAYLAGHPGEARGAVPEMRRKVGAGEYHVQMIFYTVGGRPRVLLNLLDKKHGGTYWRHEYCTICDGGADNGSCVVDLHGGKILKAHGNGNG